MRTAILTPRYHARVFTALLYLMLPFAARAHQFLQGRMEVIVYPDKITVWASVPLEEVVIQLLLPVDDNLEVNTQAAAYKDHGKYLLKHISVNADKKNLTGKVQSIQEPANNKFTIGAPSGQYVTYELDYALPAPPASIELAQNILHEVEFSPGTPWQMTFIAGIRQDQKSGKENLLLDSSTKINFDCNWSTPPDAPKTQPAATAQTTTNPHTPPESLKQPLSEPAPSRTPFIAGILIGLCAIYLLAIMLKKKRSK